MNILNTLKKICPLGLLFRLKYSVSFFLQKELSFSTSKKKIFFLDAPDYGNVGDQAIALAIRKFAEKYFSDYEFVEILQNDVARYIKFLNNNIAPDDLIFLTGGGNMGNIYRIFEATRRFIISKFRRNKVVVFPQTIDYTDDFFGKCSMKKSQKIYSSHKNLILCAREKKSYEKMKELYPFTKVILCPDIVLSSDGAFRDSYRKIIAYCLRNDIEKSLSEEETSYIKKIIKEKNSEVKIITTSTDVDNITYENREDIVQDKLYEIAQSKLMVTDRLHAMIFCVITNTPCIVFDNSNHKIIGVYEWIKHIPYIKFLENIDDFEICVNELINAEVLKKKSELNFDELINAIREENSDGKN